MELDVKRHRGIPKKKWINMTKVGALSPVDANGRSLLKGKINVAKRPTHVTWKHHTHIMVMP
jgi:hypothetical protein